MENLMADLEADLGAWDLGIRDQIQVTAMRQIRQLMLRKVCDPIPYSIRRIRAAVHVYVHVFVLVS